VERTGRDPASADIASLFLKAVKAGDLASVQAIVNDHSDLLLAKDDYYGSAVRAATDLPLPDVADYLAHVLLQRLREGTVPPEHLYGAIHDLGEAARVATGYRGCEHLRCEAEPVVAGFLAHDDPRMRYIAISVLSVHWDLSRHAESLKRMCLLDPDEWVRQIAVSGLGWLLRGTRDRKATHLLMGIVRDADQPEWIRETSYEGLLEIWHGADTAHRWFLEVMRGQEQVRAAAERAETDDATMEVERQAERVWQDFVDWEWLSQLEQGGG
jgi:hypothetical protein